MAKQSVGIGSAANDGTGDPLRTAFDKINDNTDELYTLLGDGTTLSISGDVSVSGGAVTIANDAIDEVHLNATNSPTDGYVLEYDSGSGGFTWGQKFEGDITGIVAGNGLTGDATSGDASLAVGAGTGITVNADDIQISDGGVDTLQLADDGVTYAKMGSEFTTAATISASDVDFSSAAVFTKTLAANTTLTFSNVSTGMVKDLVITGNYTLALPASVKTITGTYDGTVSNLIQIVSTNGSTEQWATISQEA
jgi:hypothetical protein